MKKNLNDEINIYEEVGKKLVALDITNNIYPTLEIICEKNIDEEKFAKELQVKIEKLIKKELYGSKYNYYGFEVKLNKKTRIIKAEKEEIEERKTALKKLQSAFAPPRNEKIIYRKGYWKVHGIRHSCTVYAFNNIDAIDKALKKGEVGEWEWPVADFIGSKLN